MKTELVVSLLVLVACGAPESLAGADPSGTETSSAEQALNAAVVGLSMSGADGLKVFDDNLLTSTAVQSTVGSCPGNNSGQFMLLNAAPDAGLPSAYCQHLPSVGSAFDGSFFGWVRVALRINRTGLSGIDLGLTQMGDSGAATVIFTSEDGVRWSAARRLPATSNPGTATFRVATSSSVNTFSVIVGRAGRSSTSANLSWFELTATPVLAPTTGTIRIQNDSQFPLTSVRVDGVELLTAGRVDPGQFTTRTAAIGRHSATAKWGYGPGAGLAAGAWICDGSEPPFTVFGGQEYVIRAFPLSAADLLGHCADVTYSGTGFFRTATLVLHAGSNRWEMTENVQGSVSTWSGTIRTDSLQPNSSQMGFTLVGSGWTSLSIGWPFATFFTPDYQFVRDTAW